jgi:hypothetical protein
LLCYDCDPPDDFWLELNPPLDPRRDQAAKPE